LYLADVRFPLERANGIQTFETCYALARRGHAVTLVVRPDSQRPARDPFAFYDRPAHDGLRVMTASAAGAHTRRARYVALALRLACRPWRWDVVFTRDLGIAALLVGLPRRVRPPVVYESHGYAPEVSRALPQMLAGARKPSARKLKRQARRERRVWQEADGYVTITEALAHELAARFGARDARLTVPDGVRAPTAATPAPALKPDRAHVVYAGHLYPWKGVDVLLDAVARLPRVTCTIVGGHPGESDLLRLQHRAASLAVSDRVRFIGMVPPAEVPAHLAQAHVLVLPNIPSGVSERYTSPLKLFEYLAAARPIVASDLPALREVVTHGIDAWLVAPGDAAALAAGIAQVLADAALAARLAEAGRLRSMSFTWEARAERLEQLLSAVSGPARSAPG
jgi:glycosyltransferase involved in cell wall biosynthesis